jgi:8-oxo-dGTP diphosphatase
MSSLDKDPQPCVGIMIFKDGKVLLGKRSGKHAPGEYSFPGGRIEYKESFKVSAMRETLEEAGIKIKNLKFQSVSNIDRYSYRHDIVISLSAEWDQGEPQTFPDERIGNWQWYDLDKLPAPLFYPTELMINLYKKGENYYDKE